MASCPEDLLEELISSGWRMRPDACPECQVGWRRPLDRRPRACAVASGGTAACRLRRGPLQRAAGPNGRSIRVPLCTESSAAARARRVTAAHGLHLRRANARHPQAGDGGAGLRLPAEPAARSSPPLARCRPRRSCRNCPAARSPPARGRAGPAPRIRHDHSSPAAQPRVPGRPLRRPRTPRPSNPNRAAAHAAPHAVPAHVLPPHRRVRLRAVQGQRRRLRSGGHRGRSARLACRPLRVPSTCPASCASRPTALHSPLCRLRLRLQPPRRLQPRRLYPLPPARSWQPLDQRCCIWLLTACSQAAHSALQQARGCCTAP
jgi:hypothetical protein